MGRGYQSRARYVVRRQSKSSPIAELIHRTNRTAIPEPFRLLHCEMNRHRDSARIRRERTTVRAMVEMYCRHHHGGVGLCNSCAELADYADRKLDRCPYGGEKPACTHCPIHCYGAEPRERMREVMRFAGPRMLARHPYLAVRHLLDERKKAPELPRKGTTRDD